MTDDLAARGKALFESGKYANIHAGDDIPLPSEPDWSPADHPPDQTPVGKKGRCGVTSDNDKPEKRSQASQLVDMALDKYTLGVTDTGEPYGVHRDRPHIAHLLRGGRTGLRAELAKAYFAAQRTAVSQQALSDAAGVLEGFAAEAPPRRVYLRVAEHAGTVYIDTGDTAGHVIEIIGGTWSITDAAPVVFRRTKLTGELPKPSTGGDLSKLWKFVPIAEADGPLLLAWMVQAAIQPDTAHPVLAFLAEQGSAKSTVSRMVVDLIDPSPVPLRKEPRDAEGWVSAANASWLVALDNLSGEVSQWLSDSLCRAVTGDGDVRRALYTDSDVAVIAFRRAIVINGIDLTITRGDLAERLLPVELPRIRSRRKDSDLAGEWADARPDVLGGFLTLAAQVHHQLGSVTVTDAPRMADYAQVLAAVDAVLGTDGLARYRETVTRSAARTLDAPFVAEIVKWSLEFEAAPASAIKEAVEAAAGAGVDRWRAPKGWPTTARAVTSQLTRDAPALRTQGWQVENDGGRNISNRVLWTIRRPEITRNPSSSDSSDSSSGDKAWSSGMPGDELGDEESFGFGSSVNSSSSSSSSDESTENLSRSVNSSKKGALTCGDELTSQTSQQSGQSLDGIQSDNAHSPEIARKSDSRESQDPRCGQALANAKARRDEHYRNGVCTDCGERPHSAGRPRCNGCHRIHAQVVNGYEH